MKTPSKWPTASESVDELTEICTSFIIFRFLLAISKFKIKNSKKKNFLNLPLAFDLNMVYKYCMNTMNAQIFLKFRGRPVTGDDISFIKDLISKKPDIGRCELSRQICQAWNWRQQNGALKDMVCRGLLLQLEREGYIILPPRKMTPLNPFLNRQVPEKIEIQQKVLEIRLNELKPIDMIQVRRTSLEKLFNSLISQYHYLGYIQPVGEHLKYLFFSKDQVIGCFAWSSAVRHLASRDRFIGWNAQMRQKNLHLVAYNSRFLIPPWIRVPHLASYLLAQCSKKISGDWQKIYSHPIYFLETFVDTERFKGTCYRAANWIYLGKTTGRGKNDQTGKANRSIKAVWGYPLEKNFKELLCY